MHPPGCLLYSCCSTRLIPLQQVISWLKQRTPQEEQAALAAALRQVVADKLLQHLLLAWLSPDGGNASSKACATGESGGKGSGAAVEVVAVAGAPAADAAEPMAVDGCGERQQQGAAPPATVQQQQQRHAAKGSCDEFVCCRAGAAGEVRPCGGGKAGGPGAPNGCRDDKDLEEAGITPGSKPPLRVRESRGGCWGWMGGEPPGAQRGRVVSTARAAACLSSTSHTRTCCAPALPPLAVLLNRKSTTSTKPSARRCTALPPRRVPCALRRGA